VILIIIVDNLRFFTHPQERSDGTKYLVSRLVNLYRDRPAAALKLLFASPTKCEFDEEFFEDGEILALPRDISSAIDLAPARQRGVFDSDA
jgi:hypothetical protein